ncbi:MAG TPA: hypothetical protein VKV73_18480 [Chloroflexota bacterium]|nr:hypothetical protein [Chloroflexota bacterium]
MIQQPSIALGQPRMEPINQTPPISRNHIVALLQVILATRRAAFTDDDKYWSTVARGM